MKTVSMSGSLRENVGKKDAKALRHAQKVPCVLYGGKEQIHFSVLEADFRHLVYSPEVAFVELNIDGKVFRAILQEMQFHPVSDSIYHADFVELNEGRPIIMGIPVKTKGLAKGVTKGGKLTIKLRKMKVKAMPDFMPESIVVDVTKLGIAQSVKVRDLNIEGIEFLDAPNAVVATVRVTRAAASAKSAAGDDDDNDSEEEDAESAE
jgi:large subunit ribosomal protein L25